MAKILADLIEFKVGLLSSTDSTNNNALIMLIISIVSFPVSLLLELIFSNIGEAITFRIRTSVFGKMVKMPIEWFEKKGNDGGQLAGTLERDCRTVNGLLTSFVFHLTINISTLVFGIVLALIYEWRTSLVALGLIPLIIISGAIQLAFSTGLSAQSSNSYK